MDNGGVTGLLKSVCCIVIYIVMNVRLMYQYKRCGIQIPKRV